MRSSTPQPRRREQLIQPTLTVRLLTPPGDVTVLIVDDEPLYADAHARMLDDDDRYHVLTAYDGRAALDVVDDTVDVLLVDRRMPHISGDEVVETLEERGLDCRRIMISAIDPTVDAVEAKIDDYLTKPVTGRELEECIERALG